MRSQGSGFPAAGKGQVRKEQVDGAAGNFRECIAIEETKGRGTVAAKEQIEKLGEAQLFGPCFFPEVADFLVSF